MYKFLITLAAFVLLVAIGVLAVSIKAELYQTGIKVSA